MMKIEIRAHDRRLCPSCHHALVPVHAVEGERRTVWYLTCPEPYCEYAERLEDPRTPLTLLDAFPEERRLAEGA